MSVIPVRPKGPHLNALRAFEAAARLGGFAAAAQELCVTPAAISQHIKALEAWAGAPLFERKSQGVALTVLGARASQDFRAAFDALGAAQRALRDHPAQTALNIAALPSVAQLWLSPRLPDLRALLPGHTLSVTALETAPNLRREMFDLSLFFGHPTGADHETILMPETIFPVCTPRIADRLTTPADLAAETMVFDATWHGDWARWLERAGFADVVPSDGPVYSLYSIAVEEACNGAGILIGHAPLIDRYLQTGALVAPFTQRISSGRSLIARSAVNPSQSPAIERLLGALML